MDDITASILVQCQTSGAAKSISKLGFSIAMLGKQAFNFGIQAVQEFRGTQDAAWKFGKTFKNTMGSAEKAVTDFMDSYNLSEKTARSMLTDTAQVLKGFGFDEKQALKLSEQVSRMGVDMASFTGYAGGAKGAVEAITAGMLGETERLKGLGTVIRMDSDEFKTLTKEMMKTNNVTETQARAMATLELVMRKNKDAIGDYAAEGENFTQTINNLGELIIQVKSDIGEMIYEVLGLNDVFGAAGEKIKDFTKTWREKKDEWIYSLRSVVIDIQGGLKLIAAVTKPLWSSMFATFTNIVNMMGWLEENWGIILSNMNEIGIAFAKDIVRSMSFIANPLQSIFWNLGNSIAKAFSKGLKGIKISPEDIIAETFLTMTDSYLGKALQKAGASKLPKLAEPDFNIAAGIDSILDWWNNAHKANEERYRKKLNKSFKDKDIPATQTAAESVTGWGDLAREFAKIRQTSQSAVLANSLEGMRMQSRMLLSPEMGDPQKRSAKSLETLTNQGKEMLNKMDSALAALTGVKSNTAAFAGISGTKRF